MHGCTNPGRQVARTTIYFVVPPNICGSSVWNLLHVTLLEPRILKWLLDFFWGGGGGIFSSQMLLRTWILILQFCKGAQTLPTLSTIRRMSYTIPIHLLEYDMSRIQHHTTFLYYLQWIPLRSEGGSLVCLFWSSNSLAHFLSQHNTRVILRNLDDFYAQMTTDKGVDRFSDGVMPHVPRILLAY